MNMMNKNNNPANKFENEKERASDLINDSKQAIKNEYQNGKEQAENMYSHVKDSAYEMYEDGKKKVGQAQDALKGYSNDLVDVVKDKPLSSLLIAGGIGYLLSLLLKK